MKSLPSPVARLRSGRLALLLLALTGCAVREHPTPLLPIAAARQQEPGTQVTVGGAVTVPAGLFQSSTRDEGFALQDPSGGIYVSLPIDVGADVGQVVGVTGKLTGSHGQLTVVPATSANVVKLTGIAPVEPRTATTGAVGEGAQGRLVRVSGKISAAVHDDLPYGYKFNVDDGSGAVQVFVHASTGIDVSRLRPGEQITVVGFGARYDQTYEILPRFAGDVQAVPPPTKRRAKKPAR